MKFRFELQRACRLQYAANHLAGLHVFWHVRCQLENVAQSVHDAIELTHLAKEINGGWQVMEQNLREIVEVSLLRQEVVALWAIGVLSCEEAGEALADCARFITRKID